MEIHENFTTDISVDEKELNKFWKLSASGSCHEDRKRKNFNITTAAIQWSLTMTRMRSMRTISKSTTRILGRGVQFLTAIVDYYSE